MKHIITIALIALTLTANAQTVRKQYELERDFGLNGFRGKLQLKNATTLAQAKADYPRVFAWYQAAPRNWPETKVMNLSLFDAAHQQAVLSGWLSSTSTGTPSSYNDIDWPAGEYWVTVRNFIGGGHYIGKGSGYVGSDNDFAKQVRNTSFHVWHDQWQDDPSERSPFVSTSAGGSGNSNYVESGLVESISIYGHQDERLTEAFTQSGIKYNLPGELSRTVDVKAWGMRTYGIETSGATPHYVESVSLFDNVKGGLGCDGCWGATITVNGISGDSNGALIYADHGPTGVTGGGTWSISGVGKLEEGATTTDRSVRGQAFMVVKGQFAVTINAASLASKNGTVDAAIVTDARMPNGNPQSSFVNFVGGKLNGFRHILHDMANRKAWQVRGDYHAASFRWYATGGGQLFSDLPHTQIAACAQRVDYTRASITANHTNCLPYREIANGPPRASVTTYVDQITGTNPPPVGTWTCTTYGTWSACVGNTQTRTRTCTCGPVGSTCVDPKPAESESQACTVTPAPCTFAYSAWSACTGTQTRTWTASPSGCTGLPPADSLSRTCTVTPPPTGGGISPSDVTILSNSSDARSAAWATAYASVWGIPASNIVSVAAGTSHDASTTAANALRNAAQNAGRQFTALAFEYPSRVGSQSITSYVTFGSRSVSNMTVSALYNYTGTKPFTDKGVRPSWLLVSNAYIRRDAHATNPTGQAILLLAKDMQSNGNTRGAARASQSAAGVTVWDNRSISNIGSGVNPCNWISRECWVSTRNPGTVPVIAGYQSMYGLGSDGGTVWAKGFFGDHVTSWGGYLPDGNGGQTTLKYHLDRGASLSVGAVVEPGGNPGLARQFVNVTLFHPRFVSGLPVGVAAWSAVECPDRMLFAGDGMCAPFLR